MAHARANAGNLVCRHANTHAGPADKNAARRLAGLDGVAHFFGKIRIVVGQVARIGAKVDHLVAGLSKIGAHFFFQGKSRMVRGDD